ncbi:MAG: serine/threonine-protein kinase [Polyangiaceae bacterium]
MSDDEDILSLAKQRIGTVLHGKYRLDAVLGVGGMAMVFAATHRNQKKFAVKMLHAELSIRSELRTRFLREGYVANSVQHEGVVSVLDDDVDETGAAFLVMELLDGSDVQGLSSRAGGKLPLQAVLSVAHQLLDVLDAAHKKAVIHRDIKPANLFALPSGQVKVLDFGIARLRDATTNIKSTRAGAVLGTPAFMAPEQAAARGDDIEARTDLWAVGATLFALLSGQLVHVGDNEREVLIRAATTPARSLLEVAPETPLSVVQLVTKALMFDKAARWESAGAMREAVVCAHRELFGELSLEPLRALVAADQLVRQREASSGARSERSASALAESETAAATAPGQVPQAQRELLSTTSKPVATPSLEERARPALRRSTLVAGIASALLVAGLVVARHVGKASPSTTAPSALAASLGSARAAAPLGLPSSAVLSPLAVPEVGTVALAPARAAPAPAATEQHTLSAPPRTPGSASPATSKGANTTLAHRGAKGSVATQPLGSAASNINPLQIELQ